jgi:murein DD-endopeptidase MepM/ murein hydrolase activator NlpD
MPEPSSAGKNGSAIGLPKVITSRVPPLTAHPVKHARSQGGGSNLQTAASRKSVDITGLIQSILEPGSMNERAEYSESPWSRILGGPARLTSKFGMRKDPFSGLPQFHDGVDIAAKAGTEVFPSMPGRVKFSGWKPGYGKVVVVEHPNGLETVYGHTSKNLVKAGDTVTTETAIAEVGSTGRSTGPHLHFEVRRNDVAFDPMPLLTGESLHVAQAL